MKKLIFFIGAVLFAIILGNWAGTGFKEYPTPPPSSTSSSETTHSEPVEKPDEVEAPVQKEDLGGAAFYFAQEESKQSLKAPSTAHFSSPYSDSGTGWKNYGFNRWMVFGFVDAQNSFGVPLRENWSAVVELAGSDFRIAYLKMGDDEIGSIPLPSRFPPTPPSPAQIAAAKVRTDQAIRSNAAKALAYNLKLAQSGDAYGEFRMGERCRDGEGVAKDLRLARQWFAKAAAQGQPDATHALATLADR